VLQKTVLGWTLCGKTPTTTDDTHHTFFVQDVTNLEANLNRFWEVEQVESSSMTNEQQDCEQHLQLTTLDNQMVVLLSDCQ
jgi:hypothetical protein